MNKNNLILFIIGILVIGGGGFFLYTQSQKNTPATNQNSTSVTPTTAMEISPEASPSATATPSGVMKPSVTVKPVTTVTATTEAQTQQ